MPRVCTICTHPDRDAIERALVSGTPAAQIAALFSVSADALPRHKANHLRPLVLQAARNADETRGASVLEEVRALHGRTLALLAKAEEAGKIGTAVMAVREARGNLELLAKLLGELDERPQVNVLAAPEWRSLQVTIYAALVPFPEARQALAAKLAEVADGGR